MSQYSKYTNWKGWDLSAFGRYTAAESLYYSRELRRSGVITVRGIRILDYGFGNGPFMGWALDQGAECLGSEVDAVLVDTASASKFEVYRSDELGGGIRPGSLDLVVAWDVLEHLTLDELLTALEQFHVLLKVGGRLIARVPSGDSPFSRAIQNGDGTHKLAIGSLMVRQAALQANMDVLDIRAPFFPLRGFGAVSLLRRAGTAMLRAMVYPVVSGVLMGYRGAVVAPALLFVLGNRADADEEVGRA